MHPVVQCMVEKLTNAYAVLKRPRSLLWVPYLGTVEVIIT